MQLRCTHATLQVTARFEIIGDELAEIETVPQDLDISERYKIPENTRDDVVAAISIAKLAEYPLGIDAIVIIIAK
jgi:hypothetical protein